MSVYSIRYDWLTCVLDGVIAKRVQTLGSSTDFASEMILEIGDKGYAEVTDEATVSVTLDTNDWGSVNTIALLANLYNIAFAGGNGGYKGSLGDNTYVVTEDDFETAAVDITAPVSEDGTLIARTLYLGYCFVSSLSFSYDVGGIATENYSLESDYKRWYLNDHKAALVYLANYSSATTAKITGVNLQSGYTGLLVTVNGVVQADQLTDTGRPGMGSTITLTNSSSDTDVTASPALLLVSGDRIRVVVSRNSYTTMTFLTATPSGIGGAKKGLIEILMSTAAIAGPVLTGTKVLRLQSVAIDVDLSREALEELGNYRAYSRTLQTPIPITCTVTANDTDLAMWANLSKLTWDANLDELDIRDFVKTSVIEVRIFKDKVDHTIDTTGSNGTTSGDNMLLKLIRLENCSVTSENHTVSVGGIAQQEFTLTAETIIVSGTGLSPLI